MLPGKKGFQILSVEAAGKAHGGNRLAQAGGGAADIQPFSAGCIVYLPDAHHGLRPDGIHQIQLVYGRIERNSQDHGDASIRIVSYFRKLRKSFLHTMVSEQ